MKKRKKTGLEIEEMIDRGESVVEHLPKQITPGFHKKLLEEKNVLRTTVDFGVSISKDLDRIAALNNISKAAVIKMAVLDYIKRFNQYKK